MTFRDFVTFDLIPSTIDKPDSQTTLHDYNASGSGSTTSTPAYGEEHVIKSRLPAISRPCTLTCTVWKPRKTALRIKDPPWEINPGSHDVTGARLANPSATRPYHRPAPRGRVGRDGAIRGHWDGSSRQASADEAPCKSRSPLWIKEKRLSPASKVRGLSLGKGLFRG